MKTEPNRAYITQPIPVPICGKAFKVIFKNGDRTPLLTKEDAEYVLSQSKKRELSESIKTALKVGIKQ